MSADTSCPVRTDQGHCEVEFCTHTHGEADLQRAFIMCSKNPGHEEFIPVYKFRKEHLPGGFQEGCLVELIQVLSHLTVRVAVGYTSESRPQTCPHNGTPYPFYMQRDTTMARTGSGWVWNVERFSQMYDQKTCPCQECRMTDNPETKWAEIVIGSAAHVVFDDKEGKHTICHLFYDKGSTPEICPGVVTLRGMFRVDTNIKEDKCKMIYITHDMDLADRLESLTKRFVDLQKTLNQMYNSNFDSVQMQSKDGASQSRNPSQPRYVTSQRSNSRQATCLISQSQNVNPERLHSRSHTHGRLSSQNVSPERTSLCPTGERSRPRNATRRQGTINRSPLRNITTNTSPLRTTSNGEVQTQNATDIHLPKIIVTAQNSAGHNSQARNAVSDKSNSFSYDKSKSSIAVGNQSQSTHVVSGQSQSRNVHIQLNSRKILFDKSPTRHPILNRLKEREFTYEKTESTHVPRIMSQLRDANNNQSESTNVIANQTESTNTKVNQSDSPIANQSDASNARVNRSDYSTNARAKVLQPRNVVSNREQQSNLQTQEHQSRNVISQRSRRQAPKEPRLIQSSRSQSTDGRLDTTPSPALTIIVSHPHGCNKQVTIGYYTERVEVKDSRNLTRYVYTTPTCPGSSGAPVYVLGRWRGWWPCDHPHSGNSDINKELNFSGVGLH